MIKSKFLCVMEKNATTEVNEITVGEIRSLTNNELKIMEGANLFLKSYAINGNFAGYLLYGASGPIKPTLSLELVKSDEPPEATAQGSTLNSDKPFIHRGNLSNKKLIEWLQQVINALKGEGATRQRLAALEEDMKLYQSWVEKEEAFISESIYPKIQDPIQGQGTQDNAPCKNVAHSQQSESHN